MGNPFNDNDFEYRTEGNEGEKDYAGPISENGLELDGQTIKLGCGRRLANLRTKRVRATMACDFTGPVTVFCTEISY